MPNAFGLSVGVDGLVSEFSLSLAEPLSGATR